MLRVAVAPPVDGLNNSSLSSQPPAAPLPSANETKSSQNQKHSIQHARRGATTTERTAEKTIQNLGETRQNSGSNLVPKPGECILAQEREVSGCNPAMCAGVYHFYFTNYKG